MQSLHRTILIVALALTGCNTGTDDKDDTDTDTEIALVSVALTGDSSLLVDDTTDLVLTATWSDDSTSDASSEATWESSATGVATVSGGTVTAVGVGSADITATFRGQDATLSVTVDAVALTGEVTLRGWPVAGVTITVDGSASGVSSDADGSYTIEGIGGGTHEVVPTLAGHHFDPPSVTLDVTSAGGLTADFAIVSSAFPDAVDPVDDAGDGDDTATAPVLLTDGPFHHGTIWPAGDRDWYAVDLEADATYEFFTTNICETCDTEISLYESDGLGGVTQLRNNDDFVDYDSQVTFTPTTAGTYWVEVIPHDETDGVVDYMVGVLTFVDDDEDEYGAWHDCDDNDPDISVDEDEVPGDAVDENCDGFQAPSDTAEDADEATNDVSGGAIALPLTVTSYEEYQFWGPYLSDFSRTLHDATDVDWFVVTVPANGWANLYGVYASDSVFYTVYDEDGTTELEAASTGLDYNAENTSATPHRYFIKVDGASTAAWYYLVALDYGVDVDGDEYYTQDWAGDRDCDDSDGAVGPEECSIFVP